MWGWSKFFKHPIKRDVITPLVTLLIPAHNEVDVIRRKLQNSISLEYPNLEILVVDDGSTDGTPDLVQEFQSQGVKLYQQQQRGGKMSAVNTGFVQAMGEIVVLSDASPSYDLQSLQQLMQPFADASVGVVVGTLAVWDAEKGVAKQAGLYWRYEAALRRWESETGSTVAVHGNMFAIRKTLFHPLAAGTVNDEFSLAMEAMRQGYRVVYQPEAISYDDASSSMEDEFNRRVRINAGRYQALFNAGYLNAPTLNLTFRLISHKLLRPLTPIFMVLMVASNLLGVIWGLLNGFSDSLWRMDSLGGIILLSGQLAFYGFAWLGRQYEKQDRKKPIIISLPYFFVSSNMAALFGLWRWIMGRQKVTWQKRRAEL